MRDFDTRLSSRLPTGVLRKPKEKGSSKCHDTKIVLIQPMLVKSNLSCNAFIGCMQVSKLLSGAIPDYLGSNHAQPD